MDQILGALEGANILFPDTSLGSIILSLGLSFVLGQLIAWVYTATHSGLSYSRSFTQSLVLMTMLVSLVMFVIGNSIIAAFGLLGALAIIRFRNVLKDTRDTVFVFLSLVLGMACGTQRYLVAIVGSVVVLLAASYLHWTGFGGLTRFDGYLSLQLAAGETSEVQNVIQRFCRLRKEVSRQHGAGGVSSELVYQVGLRDRSRGGDMVAALKQLEGVAEASLVVRDELGEV